MPTIKVYKDFLVTSLDRSYSTDEFRDLCFEYGIELEEEISEKELALKEGVDSSALSQTSNRIVYMIDIPANRYDLLCPEGLTRALRVYLGLESPPQFKLIEKTPSEVIRVEKATKQIRPFVVGAILRNITFTPENYENFIALQEKLHHNICRRRTLVAIGTHDYDTVKGPFTYTALSPKDILFVPLNQTQKMNGIQLMEFYESDRRLSKFLPIIRDSPVYPVVLDGNGTVCSLPPIINGDHSKITLKTRNVFIECTATNQAKAEIVLDIMVTMFSQYAAEKFTVEPVLIDYGEGQSVRTPALRQKKFEVSCQYINDRIGVSLKQEDILANLRKMSLSAEAKGCKDVIVSVPPTRADILHPCDIMEDAAIAFNFNKIPKLMPKTNTMGKPLPVNKLSDALRIELAMAGFTEVMPLILCSRSENFERLRRPDDEKLAVQLANPKTIEYQVVRTSLLPGLLKTLRENKSFPTPIQLFEVSDVVFKDSESDTKARNERHLAVIYCNKASGFEVVHGVLDRLMSRLSVPRIRGTGFHIAESSNETFFKGRRADVFYKSTKPIGVFGVVHPEVLESFGIPYPCSALELNIEPFI